jgi:hypothetical protein
MNGRLSFIAWFFSSDLNPHFFAFSVATLEHFVAYRYFVEDWDLRAVVRGFNRLLAVATVAVTMVAGDYYRLASEQDPKDARSHYGLGVCRLYICSSTKPVSRHWNGSRVLAPAVVETLVNLRIAYGQLRQIDRQ